MGYSTHGFSNFAKQHIIFMKVLYCHDNIYQQCPDGVVYSPGQFPHTYWDTFTKHFDQMVVTGRGVPLSEPIQKLNVSSRDDVSFILLPNINTPVGRLKYGRNAQKRLKHAVEEADAVIIRAVSDIGWIAYKHAKKMNKPIAMEMAACAWDSTWNHGNKLGKIYAPIRYIRDRIITRNADYVMYVSEHFLQNRYPTHGEVENASNVRIEIATQDILGARLKRIKETEENKKRPYRIGLIGNLNNKIKGIADTLNALAIVQAGRPGAFSFHHLGPGDSEPYIQQARDLGLSDIVHFDGMIQSGPDVLNWLDDIDLYLQPSYQEGVPRATIESMSRGCPVIASDAGGIPELINHQWMIKPGDVQHLADLIIKMLDSSDEKVKAASENFEKSYEYTNEFLSPRRKLFWAAFADYVKNGKKYKTHNQLKLSKP